jgi:TonB family protein
MRNAHPGMSRFAALTGAVLMLMSVGRARESEYVAPRIIDEPVWSYPLGAERDGLYSGDVSVVLSIDAEGHVTDWLVLQFTHPAFSQNVVANLPQYRFAPARARGEPVPVRTIMNFNFHKGGAIVSHTAMDHIEERIMTLEGTKTISRICSVKELDRPLTPVRVVSPNYPNELRQRQEDGLVTIDFYVDEQGRVRLPAITSVDHPIFAREAVGALTQWQFEPPTSYGQPVLVHAKQVFRFPPPTK